MRARGIRRVWISPANVEASADAVEAIRSAELIVLGPGSLYTSLLPSLLVPGIRSALRATPAPVVGLSPVVAGTHVRGMAAQVLAAIGVEVSAAGVAGHYGARSRGGVLDGWLVDTTDADDVARVRAEGIACRAVPLMMTDVDATAAMALEALALAAEPRP